MWLLLSVRDFVVAFFFIVSPDAHSVCRESGEPRSRNDNRFDTPTGVTFHFGNLYHLRNQSRAIFCCAPLDQPIKYCEGPPKVHQRVALLKTYA